MRLPRAVNAAVDRVAKAATSGAGPADLPGRREQGWQGAPQRITIDETRRLHPWRQLLADLVAPAPLDDWPARVADVRIMHFDQVRPYVTRAALAGAVALSVARLPNRRSALGLLAPTAAQLTLEALVTRYARADTTPSPPSGPLRPLVELMDNNYDRRNINATGLLGALACPANVLAVTHASGSGALAPKLTGLAASLLYLNSGLTSVFTDVATYSVHQDNPAVLPKSLRPAAWLVALAIVEGIVADSVRRGRWPEGTASAALLVGLLPIGLGTTLRQYDRSVSAAGEVADLMTSSAAARIAQAVHDELNECKMIHTQIASVPGVPDSAVASAGLIGPVLTMINAAAADQEGWESDRLRLDLGELAVRQAAFYNLRITRDLGALGSLDAAHHRLAFTAIHTLIHNAGQEYARLTAAGDRPSNRAARLSQRAILVRGVVDDEVIRIEIHDAFGLIPKDQWCRPASTMERLRHRVRTDFGGDLSQTRTTEGKQIALTWPTKRPQMAAVRRGQT